MQKPVTKGAVSSGLLARINQLGGQRFLGCLDHLACLNAEKQLHIWKDDGED
jgi:hypothetical protein